jgi:hypothetical protein
MHPPKVHLSCNRCAVERIVDGYAWKVDQALAALELRVQQKQ